MIDRIWVLAAGTMLAASLSAQSLADDVNQRLPGWLQLGGAYRGRIESFHHRNFSPDKSDTHLLNRFRIDLKIQPKPWLKVVLEGQDARIYFQTSVPNAAPHANPMDLRLGYIDLGAADHGPVALRLGRQELTFGEQRLLGNFDWINTARTFDAVRATVRRNGYRLDIFAAAVVNPASTGFDRPAAGNNLYGLYGGIGKLVSGAVIEPYVLWRVASGQRSENGTAATLDFKTMGLRWAGQAARGIDYSVEVAGQLGALGPDRVRAWAGHWAAGYTIPAAWRPRWSVEYNYASGDRDPHDGVRETFDSLYPSPHDKYGLCDQVGWRNMHDLRIGWDAKPTPRVSVVTNYHQWWLASARDALYAPTGALLALSPDGSAGTHVGQELDAAMVEALSMHFQLSAGLGHIFPGAFLKKATPGASYTFPFAMVTYSF